MSSISNLLAFCFDVVVGCLARYCVGCYGNYADLAVTLFIFDAVWIGRLMSSVEAGKVGCLTTSVISSIRFMLTGWLSFLVRNSGPVHHLD